MVKHDKTPFLQGLGGSRCDDVPCQDVTLETSKNGAHPNSSHARRKVVAVQHPKNEAEPLGKLVRNILVSNSNLLDVIHWMLLFNGYV